jgi:hypothetical protein
MRALGIGRLTMGSTVVDLTEAPARMPEPEAAAPSAPGPYEVRSEQDTHRRTLFVDMGPRPQRDPLPWEVD